MQVGAGAAEVAPTPTGYSLVDELIVNEPLVVDGDTPLVDVARLMTERGALCAVVPLAHGRFGVVTDALLRRRTLVEGLPGSAPAREAMDTAVPTARLGDSAAEALMLLLDRNADYLLVTDRAGELAGIVVPRDFTVSPTLAGASLDERIRRATTVEELQARTRRVLPMLRELIAGDLRSDTVISIYAGIRDTIVRRALVLVFQQHPQLSTDAFTWLSLGSQGRRESVPSSDIDSAVAFDDGVPAAEITRYRSVFAEIDRVLAGAGVLTDGHGATAQRAPFARTNAAWRAAALDWMATPEENQGAILTSLLVDARPIWGDPGLPVVTEVFADLRSHPGTLRLLMKESLSVRAKLRSVRELFGRNDTFDVKLHAMLPLVNLARWLALRAGSPALSTVERLRAAAGSTMLPEDSASNLIEAFHVLQRLRLRYQLQQFASDHAPSDLLAKDRLSPIDRSMLSQAVREIAAVQRRMDNVAAYLPTDAWT